MASREFRGRFDLRLAAILVVLLVASVASRVAARSARVTSHVVREPLVAARQTVADSPTTTELTEEYDDDDGDVVAGGAGEVDDDGDEVPSSTEDGISSSTTAESPGTSAAPTRPSLSNAHPPVRVSTPRAETEPPAPTSPSTTSTTTTRTTTTTTTTRRPTTTTPTTTTTTGRATTAAAPLPPAVPARPRLPPTTYSAPTQSRSDDSACPRREDIHPCQCIELPSKIPGDVETVATCKNIRNHQVLSDALKGFQHYRINFFVLDSCKLPPFPNGLFHNVDVEWMEVLNSTVQFQKNFFACSKDCL